VRAGAPSSPLSQLLAAMQLSAAETNSPQNPRGSTHKLAKYKLFLNFKGRLINLSMHI